MDGVAPDLSGRDVGGGRGPQLGQMDLFGHVKEVLPLLRKAFSVFSRYSLFQETDTVLSLDRYLYSVEHVHLVKAPLQHCLQQKYFIQRG